MFTSRKTKLAAIFTAGALARRRLADPRTLTAIDRVTGLILIAFGGKLLSDSLTSAPAVARFS